MASSYLTRAATPRHTPQTEPISGAGQVENNAGGYAWQITPMQRLSRWLCLGSAEGSYYASERDLTRENIDAVRQALDEHGVEAVEEIVAISKDGRAPKNDPALYALAIASAHGDLKVRSAAMDAIPEVARTGTHLFHFAEFVEGQRGWGRKLKASVAKWYEDKDPDALAYQLVKYRQRDGWSHADLLRLSPHVADKAHQALYNWVWAVDRSAPGLPEGVEMPEAIQAFVAAQNSKSPVETVKLIERYGSTLPREALLTEHLNDPKVWEALLTVGMPMTAMLRNLATMTRIGLLKPMGDATKIVVDQLASTEALRKARVHPMSILMGMATYASGHSWRGSSSWEPLAEVIDAMDGAFYASFDNVEPAAKRHVLALDCSHSMDVQMSGTPLSCMQGAAAMAMITDRVEAQTVVTAFAGEYMPVSISNRQRLDDVLRSLPRSVGRTDCAVPMLWAMQNDIDTDCFVIYSDNETFWGDVHPMQALQAYRQKTGINARLMVVSMTAAPFSIADPRDGGALDFVGFDTTTPRIMADFAAGRI